MMKTFVARSGRSLLQSVREIVHLRCFKICGVDTCQSRPCEQQAHVGASSLGKPSKLQQRLGAVCLLLPHPVAICTVLLHSQGKVSNPDHM